MLGDTGIHDSDLEEPLDGAAVYLVNENPDELYKRAVKAKAKILRKPENQDYGSRDFAAADLDGNIWSFGTYSGEGSS
ncbi:MAG: VOC family protein [Actinomycetota bacterium]